MRKLGTTASPCPGGRHAQPQHLTRPLRLAGLRVLRPLLPQRLRRPLPGRRRPGLVPDQGPRPRYPPLRGPGRDVTPLCGRSRETRRRPTDPPDRVRARPAQGGHRRTSLREGAARRPRGRGPDRLGSGEGQRLLAPQQAGPPERQVRPQTPPGPPQDFLLLHLGPGLGPDQYPDLHLRPFRHAHQPQRSDVADPAPAPQRSLRRDHRQRDRRRRRQRGAAPPLPPLPRPRLQPPPTPARTSEPPRRTLRHARSRLWSYPAGPPPTVFPAYVSALLGWRRCWRHSAASSSSSAASGVTSFSSWSTSTSAPTTQEARRPTTWLD